MTRRAPFLWTTEADAKLRGMRANGRTWGLIGAALGVSGETARNRGGFLGVTGGAFTVRHVYVAFAAMGSRAGRRGRTRALFSGRLTHKPAPPGQAIDLNAGLRSLEE